MTVKGWDHSFTPPNPTCMWNNGYRFILGYVGPGSNKQLTQYQVDTYHGLGLNIGLLVEGAAGDILAGPAVGADYAHQALAAATALGCPTDSCIFCLAADVDIISSNIDAAVATYRGFNSVLGLPRSGVYGDTDIITRLHDDGLASWFFLTAARGWDQAPIPNYIDVFQVQNGINICDGNIDLDTAPTMPRGLWTPTGGATLTPEEHAALMNAASFAGACIAGANTVWNYALDGSRTSVSMLPYWQKIASLVNTGTGGPITFPTYTATPNP